ncbi:MAG: hypothetical protein AMXMBFR13_46200 [Phycisphaerae bacterium]
MLSIVKHFGAAGDGTTDDTEALQHAFDAGEGVMQLSAGTYRISRPVVLDLTRRGPGGIRGDGGTARIIMAGPGPALHIIGGHKGTADPRSVTARTWSQERFPTVCGLEIVGEHDQAEGIRLQGTIQCVISQVLVRRCRYGIRLVERNRNFILANAHLYDNLEVGLFFDAVNLHQVNIIGNHISYNRTAGILLRDGEVRNVQITGNDIEYNDDNPEGSADVWIETTGGTLREMTISGNTIQAVPASNGANVRIMGAPAEKADHSGLIAIAGNLIGSQTLNLDLRYTRGVSITSNSLYSAAELTLHARGCRNLVIGANTIDYNPGVEERMKDGLRFDDCSGCAISGLAVEDGGYGTDELGGAITLVGCDAMAVSNCQIIEPAVRGIHLVKCRRCRITNNTILDGRDPRRMQTAIELDSSAGRNLIQHNLIHAGKRGAILPASAADAEANTIM